jgi:anti-anti-sigma regulatory factor
MNTILIGPNLGIEDATGLRELLLPHLHAEHKIAIGVERIDRLHSATLQVLCSFFRDRAQANGVTCLVGGAELRTAANLLGFPDLFGISSPPGVAS